MIGKIVGAITAFVVAAPFASHAAGHLRVIYSGIASPFVGPVRSMGEVYYGEFYGDTNPYDLGAIYRLDAPAVAGMPWVSTLLYYFQGDPDGAGVGAPPIPDGHGNLYGTTYGGGTQTGCDPGRTSGCGTVFELSPPVAGQYVECPTCWHEQKLVDLPPIYQHPTAALAIDTAGNLYLPTNADVVRFSPPAMAGGAWTSTPIFGGLQGYYTNPTLGIDAAGNVYGTASPISQSAGPVVYRLSPPAGNGGNWTSLVLTTFPPGTSLSGVTVLPSGALYLPTTSVAGKPSQQCPASSCAVFRIDRLAPGETQPQVHLLYSFAGNPAGTPAGAVAVGRDGSIDGPLATDSKYSPLLSVYELSAPTSGGTPWTEVLLYDAATSPTTLNPYGGQLAVGGAGGIYGLALQNSVGVAFKIGP